MKEWECVEVGHHKNVGKTIEEWQKNGWRLHSYSTAGNLAQSVTTCYLKKVSEQSRLTPNFPFFGYVQH